MSSRIIAVEPFDLVVFGGAGDLAYRKLLPALYQRHRDGQIPPVGADHRRLAAGDERRGIPRRDRARRWPSTSPRTSATGSAVETFLKRLHFVSVDAQSDAGWDDARTRARRRARTASAPSTSRSRPTSSAPICGKLGAHGLVTPQTRVIIEKPIGHDLASARAAQRRGRRRSSSERQIYRIDHYLGKETVQNLMALRFANALFEPLWNAAHVDHVQITVAESLGVEGRGGYYDHAGALRDMVQNHMLQLLCLVAMEPPAHIDADCGARREAEGAARA